MKSKTYIVIDEDYIAGPVTMEKPHPLETYDCLRTEKDFEEFQRDTYHYRKHLASLPRIARADEGKWKIEQELRQGVDFMFTWPRDLSKPTFDTVAGPQHPFKQVAVTIDQWHNRGEKATAAITIEQEPPQSMGIYRFVVYLLHQLPFHYKYIPDKLRMFIEEWLQDNDPELEDIILLSPKIDGEQAQQTPTQPLCSDWLNDLLKEVKEHAGGLISEKTEETIAAYKDGVTVALGVLRDILSGELEIAGYPVSAENAHTAKKIIEAAKPKEQPSVEALAVDFAEYLRRNNMSPNGFGGWGGGMLNTNLYGSKTDDLFQLYKKTNSGYKAAMGEMQQTLQAQPKKSIGYETETGALISEHDYQFLSDNQKARCKPWYPPTIDLSNVFKQAQPISAEDWKEEVREFVLRNPNGIPQWEAQLDFIGERFIQPLQKEIAELKASQPADLLCFEIGNDFTLEDLPSGSLFLYGFTKTLAMKSEYRNKDGACECYIVDSGEMFWGGVNTAEALNKLIVTSVYQTKAPTEQNPQP